MDENLWLRNPPLSPSQRCAEGGFRSKGVVAGCVRGECVDIERGEGKGEWEAGTLPVIRSLPDER